MKFRLIESLIYKEISTKEVENRLSSVQTSNNRYDSKQFEKLFNDNILWVGCFDNNKLVALSAIRKNKPRGFYYLNEIQSFEKDAGKELIQYLIMNYKPLYFLSNPDSGNQLISYYKQFGLNSYSIENSIWKKPIVFFYTDINDRDAKVLVSYLDANYSEGK